MSADLLPCPFCGNEVDGVLDVNEGVAFTPWYVVACHRCDFNVFGAREIADAIALWNQRAPVSSETARSDKRAQFFEWFRLNYPSGVILGEPDWHAAKIWRMAGVGDSQLPSAPGWQMEDYRARLIVVSALLCEPVSDKNIREARELIAPLYADALAAAKGPVGCRVPETTR